MAQRASPSPEPEPPPESRQFSEFLGALASGLVAGASDNDPTSVATLAIIGASFIYDLNWLVLLVLPMLLVIQIVSARIGMVTRSNVVEAVRDNFGKTWALVAMVTVLVVNLFTIGADLEGGAAAAGLMLNLPWQWFVVPLALFQGGLLIFGNYSQVSRILRYLVLVFVAYIFAAILARPDWHLVIYRTLVPVVRLDKAFVAAILALLGTTLTSYVYVWVSIEAEEEHRPLSQLHVVEVDAAAGITMTVVLFWFIVVATGATLGVRHDTVNTAQDAAQALEPIAGRFAGLMFALGLLASALLAIPILAATSAYVMSAAFAWNGSLNQPIGWATIPFYAVLVGSLAIGAALTLFEIDPIQLLFLAGIVAGIGTPLLLVFLLLLGGSRRVMGQYRVGGFLQITGWLSAAIVSVASIVYLIQ